jgi:hypothetical protein
LDEPKSDRKRNLPLPSITIPLAVGPIKRLGSRRFDEMKGDPERLVSSPSDPVMEKQ